MYISLPAYTPTTSSFSILTGPECTHSPLPVALMCMSLAFKKILAAFRFMFEVVEVVVVRTVASVI